MTFDILQHRVQSSFTLRNSSLARLQLEQLGLGGLALPFACFEGERWREAAKEEEEKPQAQLV